MFYQILLLLIPFFTAPYISRVLGAYNIGIFSFSNSFANYFLLFGMLGVNNYGNRSIAAVRDDREELSKTFWEIFSLQFVLSLFISTIYLIYVLVFIKEHQNIYLIQYLYVLCAAFDINWACFGLENFKISTIRSSVIRILTTILIFVFIKNINDLSKYVLILSIGSLISAVAIWPYILSKIDFVFPSKEGFLKHLKPNLVLFWPVLAVSLYNIMDKIMLGLYSTKNEVAFYASAERIVQIPCTLVLAIDNVTMPRISKLFSRGDIEQADSIMDRVMLFALFATTAMAFGLAGIANHFAPWFYGESFKRVGLFVILLSPIILFKGCAGALRTQYLIPRKQDNIYIISLTTGALVNLAVNFLLIPKYFGVGAIIGTVLAEFAVCAVQVYFLRNKVPIKKYLKHSFTFICIGSIMFGIIMNIDFGASYAKNVFLKILIGAIIYLLLAVPYLSKTEDGKSLLKFVKITRRQQ